WDINIYRGVLTGCNEAFIIDGKKKDELIAEDPKSEEIIRPLLRGRDIKRYGYEFADLYLITTFPSLRIDIEKYPAVKQHLLSFDYDRLKQTGELGARKKTNNKWFETQDSISYWEDFYKQKIIFQEMVLEPSFMLDNEGAFFCLDTGRIITGNDIEYLIAILNSKLFFFAVKNFYGGGGLGEAGVRMKHTFFEKFNCPLFDLETKQFIKKRVKEKDYHSIDKLIYEVYRLNEKEIGFIETQ
ncbi:MAG: class I SAM-dependent DNA methyltransferase, partial [Prevotellaceae bacterium]|nr:class I SAM-dependent DNA methyltransferase [Prevotellaceae bacterium]